MWLPDTPISRNGMSMNTLPFNVDDKALFCGAATYAPSRNLIIEGTLRFGVNDPL